LLRTLFPLIGALASLSLSLLVPGPVEAMLSQSARGRDARAPRTGRLVPGQVDAMLSPVRSFIFETLSILMLMELQQTCEGGQRLADSIRFF